MMAKQLRNMRDAQGLDAGSRDWGPSLSHVHSPVCLSNQILSSMTQMIQKGWGQLRVWCRKVKHQMLKGSSLPSLQAHKYGKLLGYTEEWLTQEARPVHCPSAPETSPALDSPGIGSGSHSTSLLQAQEVLGPAASRERKHTPGINPVRTPS